MNNYNHHEVRGGQRRNVHPLYTVHQEGVLSASFRSVEEVERLLRASPPSIVNKLDQQTKQPALYFAAVVEGDEISAELFKLLIRHGANIRFKDHNEQTVLFYVCREGTSWIIIGK